MKGDKTVKVIGIDHQRLHSVICLQENNKIAVVTDGNNRLIPHRVSTDGTWGSSVSKNAVQPDMSFDTDGIPWLDSSAQDLWKGFYERIYEHLGHQEPILANHWHLLISVQSLKFQENTLQLRQIASEAGFDSVRFVFPTDCLLSLFSNNVYNAPSVQVISVISVGSTSIAIRSYRFHNGNIRDTTQPHIILGTGYAYWHKDLFIEINQRLHNKLPLDQMWFLNNYFLEFAQQLTNADSVQWHGPYSRDMFSSLHLRTDELMRSENIALLKSSLEKILNIQAQVLNSDFPKIVLIGGIGSIWPFVKSIVPEFLPSDSSIMSTSQPLLSIAEGACKWSDSHDKLGGFSHPDLPEVIHIADNMYKSSELVNIRSTTKPNDINQLPSDILPPWMRDN